MGSCFSKKTGNNNVNVSVPTSLKQQQQQQQQQQTQPLQVTHNNKTNKTETDVVDNKKVAEQQQQAEEDNNGVPKKEIFIIKHRKSHDRDKRSPPSSVIDVQPQPQQPDANCFEIGVNQTNNILTGVRTSSCTKEEVDAILIQCGRLSRSNSGTGKALSSGRKYSGSKRSYDFDQEADEVGKENEDEDNGAAERRQHRQRHRHSGRASPSPQGRRRTPSRERDQQRSGSRERSGGGGGSRRVSRSPGRRSEIPTSADNTSGNSARPGKMVSVPATVSSMAMDKSNNAGETTAIKRISVKRNVGEGNVTASSRTAASPRSQSPARMNGRVGNEHNNGQSQQQPSLSRSNSRKAEQSPYRRNPLSEIDNNGNIKDSVNVQNQIPSKKVSNCSTKEAQGQPTMTVNVVASTGVESLLKPEGLTRTRSARRSRDLDFNPDGSSYTALLLEDIQNFHQKSVPPPPVSIPACVAKACSIVEAVADLNSTTGSNMSNAFSDDRRSPPAATVIGNLVGKKTSEPFVESEVLGSDDLMEPSFHKYVTVKRGGALSVDDMDGQESSGSNSFVGGSQQQWGFSSTSSTWEPNSADSTDRWSSRSHNTDDKSPLGVHGKHTTPESARDMEEARKGFSEQRNGTGRGRIGGGSSSGKNLHRMTTTSIVAANVSA